MLLMQHVSSLPKIVEEYLNFYNGSNEVGRNKVLYKVERKASGKKKNLSVYECSLLDAQIRWLFLEFHLIFLQKLLSKSFLTWSSEQPKH